MSVWRLLRATPLRWVLAFGRSGGYRLQRLGQYIDSVHGRLAPFKHVYLQSLGVDPAFQGRGHAGKLLRHALARLDAAGTPCYLDTLDEQNVGLYEHFGFSVVEATTVPGTEVPMWAMLRKAGGQDREPWAVGIRCPLRCRALTGRGAGLTVLADLLHSSPAARSGRICCRSARPPARPGSPPRSGGPPPGPGPGSRRPGTRGRPCPGAGSAGSAGACRLARR